MDIAAAIMLVLLVLVPAAVVLGLFVWAAREDGREDRASTTPVAAWGAALGTTTEVLRFQ